MTQLETFNLTIAPEQAGERLDKIMVALLGERFTRAQVQGFIADEQVTVNGKQVKAGVRLKGGEQVVLTILPPPEPAQPVEAEPIPLHVVYEDEEFAVIDKPAGLVVHPGAGVESGTLVNAILARYPEIGEMRYAAKRRGIVHRLDKDTSGLILIARTERAMHRLMAQFQQRTVEKIYYALAERAPKTSVGRINIPIARDPVQRKKMGALREGRPAVSEFTVTERFSNGMALVEVKLLTGRTHQIRVHLAFIGAPIVGDTIYGFRKRKLGLRRQWLHAARLCFDHPTTGERLCLDSPFPPELEGVLETLRKE